MAKLKFKQFSKKHCAFSEPALRYQRFNQDTNGLEELGAFQNVLSRVLIDEERYFLWIELQNTGELHAVIKLIRDAKAKGKYLSPEDAVAQVHQRGGAAA